MSHILRNEFCMMDYTGKLNYNAKNDAVVLDHCFKTKHPSQIALHFQNSITRLDRSTSEILKKATVGFGLNKPREVILSTIKFFF